MVGYMLDDAEVIVTAYGASSRITRNAIDAARSQGIKAGLLRPITLWPFPVAAFQKYVDVPKAFISVELNAGQMVEDVRLAVNGAKPVYFYGRTGGMTPTQKEILDKIKEVLN